ncbi:MAG: glycosyltransferase, partial [Thermodesulfobacteriota bacterium]
MESSDRICILIPAYNAQGTIGQVLVKIQPLEIDTIVIDDGSEDETKMVAMAKGGSVLEHPFNLGKGSALRTGFRYAIQKGYEVIITLDADGQ